MSINLTFGELIKIVRARNKMSLRDLETVSGISNARLSQIERGQNATLVTAQAIANSLDYKLWEFLKEVDV